MPAQRSTRTKRIVGLLLLASAILVGGVVLYGYLKPIPLSEGVYQLGDEVFGFSGETLELRGGRFRYWFYTDVVTGREPTYPLSGSYSVWGDTLILHGPSIDDNRRTIAILNGVNVLWRDDGLSLWKKEKRVQPYAVLVQNPLPVQRDQPPRPPSLNLIYTREMRELESKRFEGRFGDQQAEVRAMLRARTAQADPGLCAYKGEVLKARSKLDPRLVQQLVGLLGDNSGLGVDAQMILDDIYLPTHLMPDEPVFRKSKEDLHHTLDILIDSFSAAADRSALEKALLVYLRATQVLKMNLEIPEGGVRVNIEATGGSTAEGGCRMGSESFGEVSKHPRDDNWTEKLKIIIPACQQWAREQLKR
jgi:hypothetical protein